MTSQPKKANDFQLHIDEINQLSRTVTSNVIALAESGKTEKKKAIDDAIDDIEDMLIMGYLEGFYGTYDELYGTDLVDTKSMNLDISDSEIESKDAPTIDIDKLLNALNAEIGGKTYIDRIRQHMEDGEYNLVNRVVETEFHRLYNMGGMDCVSDFAPKSDAKVIVTKKWYTMRDEKVRETHNYLDGMKLNIDERFYTFDGDSALYPSDFANPENNINCRCILLYATENI